jgi:hypothetical protein
VWTLTLDMSTDIPLPRSENGLPILATRPGFAYYGDRENWCVAASVHRDSNTVERSNWHTVTTDILGMGDESGNEDGLADAAIERISNFLVGWVDYLLVRLGTPQAARAVEWMHSLEIRPVADEDHLNTLVCNEEWCVRCYRAVRQDHDSPSSRCCGKFRSEADAEDIRRRWRTRSMARLPT